jgi:hypothetical protein
VRAVKNGCVGRTSPCADLSLGSSQDSQEVRECRICQEEASVEDGPLVAPCLCAGSMRFIHPRCLQRWINEKGDAVCEVCKHAFAGEWEVPMRTMPSRSEQEQLLAAFAQGINARLRSSRATPEQCAPPASSACTATTNSSCCSSCLTDPPWHFAEHADNGKLGSPERWRLRSAWR